MATTEERLQILKMIEEGLISASEGAELLKALGGSGRDSAENRRSSSRSRWFRVRISDSHTGDNKVNVNIPMGLVDVGLRMGARFVPNIEEAQYVKIIRDAQSGKQGKIFDYADDHGRERIEIFVE